jgi:type IV pilus assembly protein PilF
MGLIVQGAAAQPTGRLPAVSTTLVLVMALMMGLGACTSTTTKTEVKADSTRDSTPTPPPTDEASLARRAAVRLELANLYFARGQADTALAEIDTAIKIKPDYVQAFNLRGLIYASLGDTAKSDENFQRALKINPRDTSVMQNYGWVLCQSQRYAAAEEQFRNALNQPNYREAAQTLRAMGVCQAREGRLQDAQQSLVRSYQIDPASPATAVSLAEVQYKLGEYEKARFYIDRVNRVSDQSNAQTLWLSARIERRLGNETQVRSMGSKLRDRYPQSPETLAFDQGRFNE